MVDGYTFSQNTSRIWICSKYPKCKVKVNRHPDGSISLMSKVHNHEPDKIVRTRDGLIHYDVVKSQRGRDLLLIKGYTYARGGQFRWICSTHHPTCKAKIKLNKQGHIEQYLDNHNHPPKRIFKTSSGGYLRV